jgi:alpha-tubulin suppressor-like RCC1 family protein
LKSGLTATTISAGAGFNCSRFSDGEAECWGLNLTGQLGLGNTSNIGDNELPGTAGIVQIGTASVASIVAASNYTCALLANNAGAKCWGNNESGQLGYGDVKRRGNTGTTQPINIPAITFPTGLTVTGIYAGNSDTCALLTDAANATSVKCWGWNNRGQLGLGKVSGTSAGTPDYIGGASNETPDQLPSVRVFSP